MSASRPRTGSLLSCPPGMDALVTDAHLRYAVTGLRALGAGGLNVVALARSRVAAGLWSRYTAARAVGPDSVYAPLAFRAKVAEVAYRRGPLVVYPCEERSIDALLGDPAALPEEAIMPYSGEAALRRLRDKRRLAALAEEVGLGAPATLAAGTVAELRGAGLPEHCVVKPVGSQGQLISARVIESHAELFALLDVLPADESLLVQEHVPGPLGALAIVVDRDGRLVARFQQTALRTWPPQAGGSSLARSVEPDEDLVERAVGLLAGAGYWGLAQLQFLHGRERSMLIDVNPRFYGSLSLALASGVNLATAWHAVVVGAEPTRSGPYRIGVTYRWLGADISAAYNGAPRILLTRSPRPRVGAMWAPDDPVPSTIMAFEVAREKIGRRLPFRPG